MDAQKKIAQMSLGLLLAIEIIKICFVFHTGFHSINLMSEKYGSLLQGFGYEICTLSYMNVPRQTLSIVFFCEIF